MLEKRCTSIHEENADIVLDARVGDSHYLESQILLCWDHSNPSRNPEKAYATASRNKRNIAKAFTSEKEFLGHGQLGNNSFSRE